MWRDHPFSQKNRTTERTVGVGVGGDREVCVCVCVCERGGGVVGKNLKRQYKGGGGGLHKIGGLAPSGSYVKRL